MFRFAELHQVLCNPETRVLQSCTCKPMVGCLGSPIAIKDTHSRVPHVMGLGELGFFAPVLGSASPGLSQQMLTQQNGVGGGEGFPLLLGLEPAEGGQRRGG